MGFPSSSPQLAPQAHPALLGGAVLHESASWIRSGYLPAALFRRCCLGIRKHLLSCDVTENTKIFEP